MFHQLPKELNGYELQEYHTEVDFQNPEVLLELIEYGVILPIVSYRKERTAYGLEFFMKHFQVRKIVQESSQDPQDLGIYVLNIFPPTKLQEAIQSLKKSVEQEENHKLG